MRSFPFYEQLDAMDCGPACLRMIAHYHGRRFSLQFLRDRSFLTRDGVSMLGISDAAESVGMRTLGVRIPFEKLKKDVPLPCIVHWRQRHFIVVYRIRGNKVFVADPAQGKTVYPLKEFLDGWISTRKDGEDLGLCLMVEPTPAFYAREDQEPEKGSFAFLLRYFKPFRRLLVQLFLGVLAGSLIQLLFPFLTQQIVDFGINNQDLGFIYLVLIAQLVLFISRMTVDFIRGWILLHMGTRINISLISDFLSKLMKLPLSFFETKLIGDLLQRIGDHRRIEAFMTVSTLNILFSALNILIFGIVLAIYDLRVLGIFLAGSLLYVGWVSLFMRRRRRLDYRRFKVQSDNQSNLIQIFNGVQEIKLNNLERQKRWEWEQIQARLFRLNVKSLALNQYQQAGATVLNETKNILVTVYAATAVIGGDMTLGMLVAVQYILGQLNAPLEQLIAFFHRAQDARISLERLSEIHHMEEEREDTAGMSMVPADKTMLARSVSFQYEGPRSPLVLDGIDLDIPASGVTAIVGVSGSGKTTLVKLLLGFYQPVSGEIRVGDILLGNIHPKVWRSKCGAVMQDGFVFSDTILNNICAGDEQPDRERLAQAVKIANLHEFVESLPLGYQTRVGANGTGLSQGQKQRLLIARAIYKDPEFLFFDEATNALDASNEKIIMDRLQEYFPGKTAVVVAHRLSTVKNAGQIVVLDKGKLVEKGIHETLTALRGHYYHLVKNQLELGQ